MFDRYTAAVAPSWGRRALAIASVALHVSAGAVLLMYTLCYIEEVPPPAVSLHFFSVAPSPPPPAASTRRKSKPKATTSAAAPTSASKVVAPKHDDPTTDRNDDNNNDSDNSSDTNGPPGPPGPPGDDPNGKPGGPPGNPRPREAAAFTLMASRIHTELPHLPDWFTAQHPKEIVHGTFRICLDTSGHVSDVSTILSIAGNVDGVLMQQIKEGWLYKPQALPVCFAQPFSFHIN